MFQQHSLSVRPYDIALYKKAKTQYEMNIASGERYEHYHQYYKKVVQRIRNFDFNNDTVKTAINSYLDGYERLLISRFVLNSSICDDLELNLFLNHSVLAVKIPPTKQIAIGLIPNQAENLVTEEKTGFIPFYTPPQDEGQEKNIES